MARNPLVDIRRGQSLYDAISSNYRFITLFRLFLAVLVLYSHSFPIFLGKADAPVPFFWKTSVSFGTAAVGGFFCLSGLLLYNSASKLEAKKWILRRIFRLFPAYVMCLLLSSFVLGPISQVLLKGTIDNYFNFDATGPIGYFWNNLFMPIGITYALNDTFAEGPYGSLVGSSVMNGSIWSLPYELRSYFVIAIVCYLFSRQIRDRLIPFLTLFTFLGYLFAGDQRFQKIVAPLWLFSDSLFLQLLTIFLIGACFGIYAKKINLNLFLLVSLFIIYYASSYSVKLLGTIGIALIGLAPFVIAAMIPQKFFTLSLFSWDISYGFYLYSFPIQQLVVQIFPSAQFGHLFFVSVFLTGVIALLSYKLIEAPMIKLGRA
jgi:peptidoglycan/LPS O-acetylase OafA/YrhL